MRVMAAFLWWFTRRRVAASWRLILVSFAAVSLATTVISATVLYANTLAERGLQHALASAPQDTLNAQLIVQERPLGEKEYRKLQASVERAVNDRLDPYLTSQARYGRTETFSMLETTRNQPGLQGYAFFLTGFEDHAALVEGRWPRTAQAGRRDDPGRVLEAVIGQDLARRMRWGLGYEVATWPQGADRSEAALLKVVGIAAPKDPADEFWVGSLDLFKLIETDTGSFIPIFLTELDFFSGIGERHPAIPGDFWWRLFLDSKGLSTGSVKPVTDALAGLETDVNKLFPRSLLLTSLDSRLQQYQRQLALAQVPVFLYSALVVAVLLYFLWVVSSLLARSRGPEVALLRSRGASLLQVVLMLGGSESVLVVLPAVLLGPVLAYLLIQFPLSGSLFAGGGSVVSPALSPGTYGLSGLVGLLAAGVLGLASVVSAGGSVADSLRQRSRPSPTMAFHRYYLDVFLLLLLGFVWWQLRDRGGFITNRLLGEGVDVSPFTLMGPAVGLLAAALVMLRLFPLAMRALARAAELSGRPWMLHGLRRVARDANVYGALTLLLTLAIALGMFGSAFSATLLDTRTSQVKYRVGGDVVIQVPFALSAEQVSDSRTGIASVDGVEAATLVRRAEASLVKGGPAMPAGMMAVQPETFADTSWFRNDFSSQRLDRLLELLSVPVLPHAGIPLPPDAQGVAVFARPGKAYPGLNLWAYLADANGTARSVFIGELARAEWLGFAGELPRDEKITPPFHLIGFFLTTGLRGSVGTGELVLDDLAAVMPGGQVRVVEAFDRPTEWAAMPHRGAAEDTLRQVGPSRARSGGALAFSWNAPLGQDVRGFLQSVVPMPLPALVGPPFKEGQDLLILVNRVLVPIRVVAQASYFPPLDPRRGTFVVLNLEHYTRYAGSVPFGSAEPPNEVWLALQRGANREAAVDGLRAALPPFASLTDREAEAAAAQEDPLTAGGWKSLVLLGLLALVGAAVLGFMLFAALSVQMGKVELAMLETIGFSRANVFLLVALEFTVVGAIGLAAGVGIGLWVGRWALSYLAAQGVTQASLPPVAMSLDGTLSGLTVAGAVLAALLAAVFALFAVWRAKASAVLREEG